MQKSIIIFYILFLLAVVQANVVGSAKNQILRILPSNDGSVIQLSGGQTDVRSVKTAGFNLVLPLVKRSAGSAYNQIISRQTVSQSPTRSS